MNAFRHLCLAFLLIAAAASAAPPEVLWTRRYTDPGIQMITDAVALPNGGFLLGGMQRTKSDEAFALAVAVDSLGDVLWSHTYPQKINNFELPVRLSEAIGSSYYIGGFVCHEDTRDVFPYFLHVDHAGQLLDENIISDKTDIGNFWPWRWLWQVPAGAGTSMILVKAVQGGDYAKPDYFVHAIDTDGRQLWRIPLAARTEDIDPIQNSFELVAPAGDSVMIVGWNQIEYSYKGYLEGGARPLDHIDHHLVWVSVMTGDTLREISLRLPYSSSIRAVQSYPDGGWIAVGNADPEQQGFGAAAPLVIRFDEAGDTLWTKYYPPDHYGRYWGASDAIIIQDGRIYAISTVDWNAPRDFDFCFVELSPEGNLLSSQFYGDGALHTFCMLPLPGNEILLVGNNRIMLDKDRLAPDEQDYWIAKLRYE